MEISDCDDVTHTYDHPGTYTVTLTARDIAEQCVNIKMQIVVDSNA